MDAPREIDTAEAARLLGLTPERVCAICRAGLLRARKLGRDWLVDPEDIEPCRARRRSYEKQSA